MYISMFTSVSLIVEISYFVDYMLKLYMILEELDIRMPNRNPISVTMDIVYMLQVWLTINVNSYLVYKTKPLL